MNDDEAIRQLEQSGEYRVIRRLHAPAHYHEGAPEVARVGLVIDTETTGLDTTKDKIIELGFVAFEYDAGTGMIFRVLHTFDGFEDPGEPLSDVVKRITGITDEMVSGKSLDEDEINGWLERTDLIIAHNAGFDRPVVERRLPKAVDANWACTLNGVDWDAEGISSRKLDYIAYQLGYFFDGHRAINDAQATLHLLAQTLPESGRAAMGLLLESAREPSRRYFAIGAAFEKKGALKERGYQWLPGFDSGNGKKGVWSRAVAGTEAEAEEVWLTETIYGGRPGRFAFRVLTPKERYSTREFVPG
ncbi:MAG TPA: 3'-5' exonuclease [Mariprofundaceae bacterium]|nr:3'-5' exonuclease [Mariprofundaceae bacterium]